MSRRRITDRWDVVDMGYETPCWIWKLSIMENGYGSYTRLGERHTKTTAHRVIYEEFRGPIPDGLTLDHLCRVLACVNPWHLDPVTMRENLMRGESPCALNARKTQCKHGHDLVGENLRIARDGSRACRRCHRERELIRYHARKAAA